MEVRHKAWSPYSRNDSRICLRGCSKEDFKVVHTSIASISCEKAILIIIATIWRQTSYLQDVEKHIRKYVFAIFTTYMETSLKTRKSIADV